MLNRVFLIGSLGKDAELRYTNTGKPVISFSIATSKSWTNANGDKSEKTEWHNCTMWGKNAEVIVKWLTKGRKVYIDGEIQTRQYEKNGEKRYATEVLVNEVKFLDKARVEEKPDIVIPDLPEGVSLDDIPF
jgi:single-strand DNA-binding protein